MAWGDGRPENEQPKLKSNAEPLHLTRSQVLNSILNPKPLSLKPGLLQPALNPYSLKPGWNQAPP